MNDNSTEYVHVVKGRRKNRFTRMAWEKMGTSKNGWELANPVTTTASAPGKSEAETEVAYKALVDQAKGFEKDGKLSDALTKMQAAATLKPSSYITGQVTRLSNLLKAEQVATLIATGNAAKAAGDFAGALEAYYTAEGLDPTNADLIATISETESKLEG